MFEITTLELTLGVVCVGLFIRGMHYSSRARAMCCLVEAMCKDEDVLKKVKQAHFEATGERV
jgi:high-affinity Fe2+/Pb2+ permease